MSKLVTKEHATLIANAVIDKVKNKGYAVESDLGSLASKDEVDKIDLSSALAQEIDSKLDAADILTYTVKKQTTADTGYSSTYQLYSVSADDIPVETPVGAKINIPKDMVVESGTVGVVTVADEPYEGAVVGDKYIDLVIANADDDHIYIPVGDLVDIYEAGNGIDVTNNIISVIIDSNNANGLAVSANGIGVSVATPSVSGVGGTGGVMSPTDKEKLDNADFVPYTEGNGIDITSHTISTIVVAANGLSVGANGVAMSIVQASVSGVGGANGAMSGSDKEKLDDVDITTASELADLIAGLDDLDDDEPVSLTALKFSSDDDFTLSVATPKWNGTMEYSLDDGDTWTTWNGSQLTGNEYQDIYMRGTGNSKIASTFNFTGKYCTGNIETLLDYQTVENGGHPTMRAYCYYYMFDNCTSLVTPPELPATTLAEYCYNYMFRSCTSLATAPELPATTLASSCYSDMFYGCISLVTPPSELPATTLANHCYYNMFYNCTSLTTAPELPATTLADNCCYRMFYNCTSLTTAPELPATTLADNCYFDMFYGCISLVTPPELPATTLAECCYDNMFYNCTSLKLSTTQTGEYQYEYRIPVNGTGTTASSALNNMFARTGGTFTGTPEINKTYYTDHQPV